MQVGTDIDNYSSLMETMLIDIFGEQKGPYSINHHHCPKSIWWKSFKRCQEVSSCPVDQYINFPMLFYYLLDRTINGFLIPHITWASEHHLISCLFFQTLNSFVNIFNFATDDIDFSPMFQVGFRYPITNSSSSTTDEDELVFVQVRPEIWGHK